MHIKRVGPSIGQWPNVLDLKWLVKRLVLLLKYVELVGHGRVGRNKNAAKNSVQKILFVALEFNRQKRIYAQQFFPHIKSITHPEQSMKLTKMQNSMIWHTKEFSRNTYSKGNKPCVGSITKHLQLFNWQIRKIQDILYDPTTPYNSVQASPASLDRVLLFPHRRVNHFFWGHVVVCWLGVRSEVHDGIPEKRKENEWKSLNCTFEFHGSFEWFAIHTSNSSLWLLCLHGIVLGKTRKTPQRRQQCWGGNRCR